MVMDEKQATLGAKLAQRLDFNFHDSEPALGLEAHRRKLESWFLEFAQYETVKLHTFEKSPHVFAWSTTGLTEDVAWDSKSLFIHGQRVFILSAEVHPWRIIPGADAQYWRDVFEKIAANGFNTVSFYTSWATHYPTRDSEGDFAEGTYRDIQLFIDEAKKAGLWLIARPGPYINAETTGGGFPGWVGTIPGSLRTNNEEYTKTWIPYMTKISKLVAANQITQGGPIIMIQAENEFTEGSTKSPYMQQIIDLYRANGVVIHKATTHNDQHEGINGNYSPDHTDVGAVDIYCADSYPQGKTQWNSPSTVYWWAHQKLAFNNPLCLAEFSGGFLLNWGSTAMGGTGYEKYSRDSDGLTNAEYDIYMLYGGTNWGQTSAPVTYSSYDYGGGISENRVIRRKMQEMRQQGLFVRVSREFQGTIQVANGTNYTTSDSVLTYELLNEETNARFYIIRQNDGTSTSTITTKLNITTSRGPGLIPAVGDLTLDGHDSKILPVDYTFGVSGTKILYSTSEIFTWTTIDGRDYIVFYAKSGQTGETAFLSSSAAKIDTFGAETSVQLSSENGVVTIRYALGVAQFLHLDIGGGGISVIILDKETAYAWHAPIIPAQGTFGNYFSIGTNESVLVSGPYLVRSAAIHGDTLAFVGDLNATGPAIQKIEVIAPSAVGQVTWNGKLVSVQRTAHRSLVGSVGEGAPTIDPPVLNNWIVSGSLPEINIDFDDSDFTLADQTTTNITNLPPTAGDKVLYSQQYEFYGGNIIFRGHFNATGLETGVSLDVFGGYAFAYTAWLNSVFLGSNQGTASVSERKDTWVIPGGTLRVGENNVLVVLMDHTGFSSLLVNGGKEPRGIRGYSFVGANTTFMEWRLQGNQGSAKNAADMFRGYLNEGGLYGERVGAHLPGFPTTDWVVGSPMEGLKSAGVNFYRTTFDLNIPEGYDVPIALSITPSASTSRFRAQIYINGWQFGKYVNDIGPQTLFALPAAVLKLKGTNTLAISLWSLDASGAAIAGLELVKEGIFATSLDASDYKTPDYADQSRPEPAFYDPM
ncbi:glycoside hydrolase family 35 protein [Flagelloscypha sp. PMI_526]|nr:glycoside hydrolase family 35 protein [Flagelloscypha sp. PMI_526]